MHLLRKSFVITLAALIAWSALPATSPVAAQTSVCQFTPHFDQTPLYTAPLADPSQQQSQTLDSSVPLIVLQRSDLTIFALFEVQLQTGLTGWVHPVAGELSGDCDALPVDDLPLVMYPSLCIAWLDTTVPFYNDAQLSTPKPFVLQSGEYVVTRQSATSVLIRLDHAMSGWVSTSQVARLSPACPNVVQDIPEIATVLADARLWPEPGVVQGQQFTALEEGSRVVILAGPETGPIQFDTNAVGEWWQVAQNGQVGWVWEPRLDFSGSDAPPTPVAEHTALENARLWSAPDVIVGRVIDYVPPGAALHILYGPLQGLVQTYPEDVMGNWYYVQPASSLYAGWIWEARIAWD